MRYSGTGYNRKVAGKIYQIELSDYILPEEEPVF